MTESSPWNAKRDESLYQAAGSYHLRKYAQFFQQLSQRRPANAPSALRHILEGPIRLIYKPVEDVSIPSLVEMENKTLSKLLGAIAGTCREIKFLKIEAERHYKKILNHGETDRSPFDVYLIDMQNLSAFVDRLSAVIDLTTRQLSGLGGDSYAIYLPCLLERYVDLFVVAITLDETIESQPSISDRWKRYRLQIRSVVHDPARFGVPETKLHALDELSRDLQEQLFQKTIFLKTVERATDVRKTPKMSDQMNCYLRNSIADVENKSNDPAAVQKNWIRINVGVVLTTKLFGTCDKKLYKRTAEINKKYYAVTLFGDVTWTPSEFLTRLLPKECFDVPSRIGEKILAARTQKLSTAVNNFTRRSTVWCFEMQTITSRSNFQVSDVERKHALLVEISTLMSQMKETVFAVTNLHATLSKPLYKSTVYSICRLIEIQRSLEITYRLLAPVVVQCQSQVLQHLSYRILSALETTRLGLLRTDKNYSKERLDALSLIASSVKLLNGPATSDRRLIVRCALAYASQLIDCFKEDEILKLRFHLDNYDSIVELNETMEESSDYTILSYHENMIPSYLSTAMDSSRATRLLTAYDEAVGIPNARSRRILIDDLLKPACEEIETSLRLHVHADVKFDSAKDAGRVIRSPPLPASGALIDPKRYVEHYLDETFYDLTTVAPRDWKTYKIMRSLARHELRLHAIDDHLPTGTSEDGSDALEIMRNIDAFVANYLYNLNAQTFVERTTEKKHLRAIGVRHATRSIATHGTGIMSTAVNLVYQFLRVKLHTFSQFLFDEHIKSRLTRETRFVKSQRDRGGTPYTYERAEKFQKEIRRLGMTEDGSSYLDKFRRLIAQIGNALGYVRLLRSGGASARSNAVAFLPRVDGTPGFEGSCSALGYGEATRAAAKRLDDEIDASIRNFDEGERYFGLLVDVFAAAFGDSNSHHLQQFYVVVPALTLSFVDESLSSKEKMSRKNQTGAAFTDDGFAMGVAYANALLNRDSELDGLRWFETVRARLDEEKLAIARDDGDDVKLRQTKALTLKRLEERAAEFELLCFSLAGARGFFS